MQTPAELEAAASRKVAQRLIPFLWLMYVAAFLDRTSIGFAALQMNRDLGFSASVYGTGAGLFFIGYCLFEVPSNLFLHRLGGPRWLARIMLSWALVAGATALVRGTTSFYAVRFLLGIAEAGFFPGIIYYLTLWIPAARRARLVGAFMTAIPAATVLGSPLSTAILKLDGALGLAGWQWLYLLETLPSVLLGLLTLTYLPATPAAAAWLNPAEKAHLADILQAECASPLRSRAPSLFSALISADVLSLCLCYFGVELALYGVIFWIPQIFAEMRVRPALLGWAVAMPYAVAALGMVWWSRHADRHAERSRHLLTAACAGALGLAASAWFVDSPAVALPAIALGASGTLAVLPLFWTRPPQLLHGAAAAGAIALINAVGNLGGFVGPYLMGALKDATGDFAAGLLVSAAGVLMTGILTILLARRPVAGNAPGIDS